MGNVAIIPDNVHASAPFDIQYIQAAMSVDREGRGEQRTGYGAQREEILQPRPFYDERERYFQDIPFKTVHCIYYPWQI